ncbi:MAG: DUF2344 domain-containing protein [Actinomycetales bacterium]|nr:DUF2344 domain-containing protein [Actinomycetales bacterium]
MARVPEGPPPAPVVQRVRLRYAKRGRLRFTSHRDIQRALERAVRRAGVPVALSAGFTPRPRISYANAVPTGAASEAEYVELALSRCCEASWVAGALDSALPPGLDVLDAVVSRSGALADRLEASLWRIELPGVGHAEATAAVGVLLGTERVEVERRTKSGMRSFDARSAIVRLEVVGPAVPGPDPVAGGVAEGEDPPCAILALVVRHATPAVRPDDVLAALRVVADLAPPSPPRMTRLAQGPLTDAGGAVADPLTIDRDVVDT